MDDRTSELREGAGLEEGRINTEFLDALQKHGSKILWVIILVFGAYAGKNWLDQRANQRVNSAFEQHVDITETASPSPASLAAIATEYGGVRGIGQMARLREADVYMRSVATGMLPGASFEIDPETQAPGRTVAEADLLTDEDRARYLDKADALYAEVIASTGDEVGAKIHEVGAWFGKAAVAETRGDDEAARAAYESAKQAAEAGGFEMFTEYAQARLDSLETGLPDTTLYAEADLPEIPEPETPAISEPGGMDEGPIGPVLVDDGTPNTDDAPADPETDSESDADAEPATDDDAPADSEPTDGE